MTFSNKLALAQSSAGSALCVGLDPVLDRLPAPFRGQPVAQAVVSFCQSIVEATTPVACGFKPNLAFFEALGREGYFILESVIGSIPTDRIVLLDGKRSDIAYSASLYAESLFGKLQADACTVAPYMGRDAVDPFLAFAGKCAFVLVRTSNPSSSEFQNLSLDGTKLYHEVAGRSVEWASDRPGEVGFVVGASDIGALTELRRAHPQVPFLIPGVGAQGGDARTCLEAAGSGPIIVNSSRKILYASAGGDFADAALRAATVMAKELSLSA